MNEKMTDKELEELLETQVLQSEKPSVAEDMLILLGLIT